MARVATHPHAVQSIAGIPGMFSYDDNGNQTAAPMAAAWFDHADQDSERRHVARDVCAKGNVLC